MIYAENIEIFLWRSKICIWLSDEALKELELTYPFFAFYRERNAIDREFHGR
jgi:hypothetical protein